MTKHSRTSRQAFRRAPAVLMAWILLSALPAFAARVVQVRVGNHPEFTRVVFELDGPAGYRVERRGGDQPELVVTIDAASRARKITSKSAGIVRVEVAAQGKNSVARVALRKSGLRLQEMILANPSRIVLDLMLDKPAPKPVAKKPAAAPPVPAPKPVAKKPEPAPKPVAKTPAPAPKPVAKTPTAAPTPVAKTPAPKPDPAQPDTDPEGLAKALGEALAAATEAPAAKPETPTRATPKPAVPKPVAKPIAPKPAPIAKTTPTAPQPTPDGAESDGPSMSILVGAGAGILLCVVGLIVLLRRRRPLPDNLDVGAIAEAAADGAADEQRSFTDMVFNETDSQSSDESPTASHDASGASDLDSFFDDKDDAKMNPETRGDEVMNQGLSDLPTERDAAALPSAAPLSAAGPDPDVLRVVHELERRMGQLEGKLGEANEARERLERQVAAQSEELRVQRAAIARTQRALRTMSRGEDEEKATEPALRDDTQAKTRINV